MRLEAIKFDIVLKAQNLDPTQLVLSLALLSPSLSVCIFYSSQPVLQILGLFRLCTLCGLCMCKAWNCGGDCEMINCLERPNPTGYSVSSIVRVLLNPPPPPPPNCIRSHILSIISTNSQRSIIICWALLNLVTLVGIPFPQIWKMWKLICLLGFWNFLLPAKYF